MTPFVRKFNGPLDWGWINSKVPILRVEDTTGIIMLDLDKNEHVAALVLDNFTRNSVQGHFVVDNPMALRHGFAIECADLIFNVLDKKFLYAQVPGSNEKAIKLNKHLGFTEKTRLPDAYADGVDFIIMELAKENCVCLPNIEKAA